VETKARSKTAEFDSTRNSPIPGRSTLVIKGLSLRYLDRVVLDDVGLEVKAGQSVSIMGPSGAGKSSLLSAVLGLVRPDSGSIQLNGTVVKAGSSSGMARLRRDEIGVIFQSGELLPELSPTENVALAGLLAGTSPSEAGGRANQLLAALGVPSGDRSVTEFSGGEQQRVAVARALMNRPSLLLADEPTGSLDPDTRDQVIDILFEVPQRFNCALIVVTHDPVVAARADRQLVLTAGRLLNPSDGN
jgi:putative ABC transport system ATP-binding protein/lipoprotein-releasing system ATP-binding protein